MMTSARAALQDLRVPWEPGGADHCGPFRDQSVSGRITSRSGGSGLALLAPPADRER